MQSVEPGMNSLKIDSKSIGYKTGNSLKRLSKIWYIVEARRKDFQGKRYAYAIVRPTTKLVERFHLERDILVIFSDESNFNQKDFIVFSNWLISYFLKDKVDKLCLILVSEDPSIKVKIRNLIDHDSESRIIIPFTYNDCTSQDLDNEEELIIERLKEFFYERDLFDHRSPLCNDTYFFGRDVIVQNLYDRYKSGENSGLFGLRKIGKTSVLYALKRRLELRNEPVIFIDCESIHLRRWHEVLQYIIRSLTNVFQDKDEIEIDFLNNYGEKEAQERFEQDLKLISKFIDRGRILIILDEIEHLTFETSPSDHWKTGKDFLLFWQAVRATFQSSRQLFAFVITGTNPKAVETTILPGDYENPIRSLVPPNYLGGFEEKHIREMVSYIGNYMGMEFDETVYQYLKEDFGGNPFLIRQACSFLHNNINTKRPALVSSDFYQSHKEKINKSLGEAIDLILETLERRYGEEYDLLKYLANGDQETFSYYASLSRTYVDHVERYGLVKRESQGYRFCIKAVEDRLKEITHVDANPIIPYTVDQNIIALISQGEGLSLEFKSTLCWDIVEQKKNKELEIEVLKAIAAFMNSQGGTLLIGVKDDGEILGLDSDYKALRNTNNDAYSRYLANDILATKLGGNISCLCEISFPKIANKFICRVNVLPSNQPVLIPYRKDKNQPVKDAFFIRNNASSKSLESLEMARYCATRWPQGF